VRLFYRSIRGSSIYFKICAHQELGGLDGGLDVDSGAKTGKIGKIGLDATGDIKIQRAAIFNLVRSGTQGTSGGIKITVNNITVTDKSEISTNLFENAVGRAGDIDIKAKGNFNLSEPTPPNVQTLSGGIDRDEGGVFG
jgi:hypothetical protein